LTSNSIQLIAEEDLQREKERSRACEKKLKIARGEEEALASCDLSELLDWHIELEITLQKLSTAIIKKAVASQLAGNSTSPTFSPTAKSTLEAERVRKECTICFENQKNVVFAPCGMCTLS
jgi:hypothetical protein